jgi:NADH-quinone oxidoreductase subunit N
MNPDLPAAPHPATEVLGVLPVVVVVFFGVIAVMAEALARTGRSTAFIGRLSALGLALAALLNHGHWSFAGPVALFGGAWVVDGFSTFFSMLFMSAGALAVLLLAGVDRARGAADARILFAVVGMVCVASAQDLLVLVLGLEVMSIAVLLALSGGRGAGSERGTEAALKAALSGAFGTAILLYGVALLFGATGATDLVAIRAALDAAPGLADSTLVRLGLLFLGVGLLCRLAAAPFHLWAPDVHEGAPAAVTALLAAGVTAAGFAALLRVFTVGLGVDALAFGAGGRGWAGVLYLVAVVSMCVGNLAALVQTDVKRMLAYATVAQVGYLLVGVVAGVVAGGSGRAASSAAGAHGAVLHNLLAFGLATFLVFAVLSLLDREGDAGLHIDDLAGVGFRRPLPGLALLFGLSSLAAVPPLVGFFGRFALFRETLAVGTPEMRTLVMVAAVNSVVGLTYHLRIIRSAYMKAPVRDVPMVESPAARVVMVLTLGAVVALGIFPDGAIEMARHGVMSLRPG